LTVDIGRDGKLYIDMHKAGMINLTQNMAIHYLLAGRRLAAPSTGGGA